LHKCDFGKTYLIYLGHTIGEGEMRVYAYNILAITQWPIPTNVTKVRSFMGATQYLRKFIVNLSTLVSPLHSITTKGNIFHWGKTQQRAFEYLKKKINDAPVLSMPNLQRPFELETDASGYALGAILMQGGRLVCYHS
jgi:hypothetical protein